MDPPEVYPAFAPIKRLHVYYLRMVCAPSLLHSFSPAFEHCCLFIHMAQTAESGTIHLTRGTFVGVDTDYPSFVQGLASGSFEF